MTPSELSQFSTAAPVETSAIVHVPPERSLRPGESAPEPFGDPARFLPSDIGFLTRYGFAYGALSRIVADARFNGVEAHEEAIATNCLSAATYYTCLADYLGLKLTDGAAMAMIEPSAAAGGIVTALRHTPRILCRTESGTLTLVTAPKREEIEHLRYRLSVEPRLHQRIQLAPPAAIRAAYLRTLSGSLNAHASHLLCMHMPQFSSFRVSPGGIIALIGLLMACFLLLALSTGEFSRLVVSTMLGGVFFATISLRFLAATQLRANKKRIPDVADIRASDLPVYSVLVAAYQEAHLMEDLVSNLAGLDWPRAKLDIKLILESDDLPTIDAARRATTDLPFIEIVLVPPGQPRTKPRALNFALPLARGAYTVIYDAEDRPHPGQLKAAYYRLFTLGPDVACVQAPLLIDNARHNLLSGLFAIEYAGLFDGVLPTLARFRLPVMLGGTSNHFKTHILRAVGAWDPYNVTEDADLGIRLKRYGYRVDVIDLPTYEEAPAQFSVWMRQRTRWFKGWMQTCLVHFREPARTFRQLGLSGFIIFHLISTTLLASALFYPFFLGLLVSAMIHHSLEAEGGAVLAFLAGNFFYAWGSYALLAYVALTYRNKRGLFRYALALPLYWLLLSLAGWRAFFQLIHAPHLWEKTRHGDVTRLIAPWRARRLT